MKNIFPAVFLFVSSFTLSAQDFLPGKLSDPQWGMRTINYDRTQNSISASIFQTVYKVFELNKTPLYTITLTHSHNKGIVLMAVNQIGGNSKGTTITYDTEEHGLIFTERGSTDTAFSNTKAYKYLLSFTDAQMDYPVLHEVRTEDGRILELDPLSKLRIRKQNEEVKRLAPALAITAKENHEKTIAVAEEGINQHLLQIRDSLYRLNNTYTQQVSEMRNAIATQIADRFESRQVEKGSKHYAGDKKGGNAEGKGILIENESVFAGDFKAGKFSSGIMHLNTDSTEYTGQYNKGAMAGTGWLKYKNGSYMLGVFANSQLMNGISLWKEKTGEIYFGGFKNNARNGYGELHTARGDMYFGDFKDGKLMKGYSKEVDPFGYATYAKIEAGTKVPLDAAFAEVFFDSVLSAQK